MFRWVGVVFYLLIGPMLFTKNLPDVKLALGFSLVTFIAGVVVSRLHLRQACTRGRVAVVLGTLAGSLLGMAACAVSLLTLAFAGDSREYADLIGIMMIGVTALIFLLFPPLGAWGGSSLAKAFAGKGQSVETRAP